MEVGVALSDGVSTLLLLITDLGRSGPCRRGGMGEGELENLSDMGRGRLGTVREMTEVERERKGERTIELCTSSEC